METIGNVSFTFDTFIEEDDIWDALFVKIGDGHWHMAQVEYNTEDIHKILQIIKQNEKHL